VGRIYLVADRSAIFASDSNSWVPTF
jgi:hypothetical protein